MATFSADLETGDLSQFDNTTTDGGDLSADAAATKDGSYGLQAVIDDTNSLYGRFNFNNKSQIRGGFWLNPNSVTMGGGEGFSISTDF